MSSTKDAAVREAFDGLVAKRGLVYVYQACLDDPKQMGLWEAVNPSQYVQGLAAYYRPAEIRKRAEERIADRKKGIFA